jgi:CheY-like chemotaxis protein
MTEPRCATRSDRLEPEPTDTSLPPIEPTRPDRTAAAAAVDTPRAPLPPRGPLNGRRILLVEDEAFVAFMIETMLLARGCREVWIEASVDGALERLRTQCPDLAVLDVNLGRQLVFPVAEQLERMGVPLLFATAHPHDWMPSGWQHAPMLRKPYELPDLLDALLALPAR